MYKCTQQPVGPYEHARHRGSFGRHTRRSHVSFVVVHRQRDIRTRTQPHLRACLGIRRRRCAGGEPRRLLHVRGRRHSGSARSRQGIHASGVSQHLPAPAPSRRSRIRATGRCSRASITRGRTDSTARWYERLVPKSRRTSSRAGWGCKRRRRHVGRHGLRQRLGSPDVARRSVGRRARTRPERGLPFEKREIPRPQVDVRRRELEARVGQQLRVLSLPHRARALVSPGAARPQALFRSPHRSRITTRRNCSCIADRPSQWAYYAWPAVYFQSSDTNYTTGTPPSARSMLVLRFVPLTVRSTRVDADIYTSTTSHSAR